MHTREELVRIIRRSQTFISILLFISIFLFSWHVTGFEITEIQLSKWGETGSIVEKVWNTAVCILSISILTNSILYIKHNSRIICKEIAYLLFIIVSTCLFIVGAFNVNYTIIHNVAAYLYFFAYPLAIFVFAHLNRKHLQYEDWVHHMILCIGMIIIPLICIYSFNGMAIAEITHIIFAILWNLKIAFK
jgi:hypothetical membrane protein